MIILVMGVAGCGKTTLGQALANALGWRFLEGDSYHPRSNLRKMSAGIALGDQDRWPWLAAIAADLANLHADGQSAVLACSALRIAYRDCLRAAVPVLPIVWLSGEREILERRLVSRSQHFMPASLLDSQLATLEPPVPAEHALVIDVGLEIQAQIGQIRSGLAL